MIVVMDGIFWNFFFFLQPLMQHEVISEDRKSSKQKIKVMGKKNHCVKDFFRRLC